jgi:tRNA (guanine-N7-)-methyltransferase
LTAKHGDLDPGEVGPCGAHEDAAQVGPRYAHIRSFALRRGHVTNGQRNAYASIFPRVAVPPSEEPIDLAAAFGRSAPAVLEIGFGMGETTAAIARAHPDVSFLCVEVFVAGIGALCRRIEDLAIANIRIIQGDAVDVVRDWLAPDSLAGVHIFFPDPWPKARHHKRRLVAQPFIGRLASRIAPGGYLHCATDWQHYAEQMLEVLGSEPQLANLHDGYAPAPRNPLCERPTTKFHQRGLRLGHRVWDLAFERV